MCLGKKSKNSTGKRVTANDLKKDKEAMTVSMRGWKDSKKDHGEYGDKNLVTAIHSTLELKRGQGVSPEHLGVPKTLFQEIKKAKQYHELPS